MTTETMNVHKALVELKTLDARIKKEISAFSPCVANKKSNRVIAGKSVDTYIQNVKSTFASIMDLIARRNAIKAALAKSNAETTIEVLGKKYAVANAIDMKQHSNEYKEMLRDKISRVMTDESRRVESSNFDVSERATRLAENSFGGKDSNNAKQLLEFIQNYEAANGSELIDPIDCQTKIGELDNEVSKFASELDAAISVSNAVTNIVVEY